MQISCEKGYRRGTHRQISPGDTLARIRPLLPRMGITRLANVTGLDTIGIPVVMAVRPNSQSISVSQGKGLDLDSAKTSAAMESVEGYHAESITLPLRLATFEQIRGQFPVVDILRLPLSPHLHFDPNLPLLWIEGQDLELNEPIYVPFQLVHTSYTPRMRWDLNGFASTSTGLASGNHLLEAISHAICEAVERDCSARMGELDNDPKDRLRIDLNTVKDADCQWVIERFEKAGVSVAAWNITGGAGIAAVECLIAERDDYPFRHPFRMLAPSGGMGCHPVPEIALLRALTEAAQSRLTVISGSRDDMPRYDYESWRDPGHQKKWRMVAAGDGAAPFSSLPRFESGSFDEDVAWEVAQLHKVGCNRVIVVDLTKPEIGIPVVRVIIPGMHDRSYREGRGRSPESLR